MRVATILRRLAATLRLDYWYTPRRSQCVAIHFSPRFTGAPRCKVRRSKFSCESQYEKYPPLRAATARPMSGNVVSPPASTLFKYMINVLRQLSAY
jgi:hypothetical protein